jgi:hypothetical protein
MPIYLDWIEEDQRVVFFNFLNVLKKNFWGHTNTRLACRSLTDKASSLLRTDTVSLLLAQPKLS